MAIGGTAGMAVTQRTVPLAPLNGFHVTIHQDGVHHAIVAWNHQTGMVAPLVIRIFNGRIHKLIMSGTFTHGNPFHRIQNAESV